MNVFRLLGSGLRKANVVLFWVGGIALSAVFVISCLDVTLRYIFNRPLLGGVELTQMLIGVTVVMTWALTQAKKGHVSIDIFFGKFPRLVQNIVGLLASVSGLFLTGLIVWTFFFYGLTSYTDHEITDNWKILVYPFKFMVPLGALALGGQFILDAIENVRRMGRAY